MFQSPGSIAFNLGPISVHWYGILIAAGIIFAYFYALKEIKRRGIDPKHVENMVFWLILSGIVGARLYYVLFSLSYFVDHPSEILQVWKGGLAIHGALIGGAAAFFIYIRRHKLQWLLYGDAIMPGILLAQGIGRWGNFFNSEAFGRPTGLPWKLFIPEENRPEQYGDFAFFHPTFLYESLWNFAGFVFLVILTRKLYSKDKKNQHGFIFCAYLIWYSFGRFFIEGLRTDSLYFGQFRIAQIVSGLLFISGIIGLIILSKKPKIRHEKGFIS